MNIPFSFRSKSALQVLDVWTVVSSLGTDSGKDLRVPLIWQQAEYFATWIKVGWDSGMCQENTGGWKLCFVMRILSV